MYNYKKCKDMLQDYVISFYVDMHIILKHNVTYNYLYSLHYYMMFYPCNVTIPNNLSSFIAILKINILFYESSKLSHLLLEPHKSTYWKIQPWATCKPSC